VGRVARLAIGGGSNGNVLRVLPLQVAVYYYYYYSCDSQTTNAVNDKQ